MNRLQSELRRLYAPVTTLSVAPPAEPGDAGAGLQAVTADSQAQVRALVLALGRPASWDLLSVVWRGVQADLAWPAPAIAASGDDGLQLWFSLAQPVPAARAEAVLDGLCQRYLADVAPARVRGFPKRAAGAPSGFALARPVPAELPANGAAGQGAEESAERWSAFVAPDLAPIFAETPWLDIPPGIEGQADLLSRLACIAPEAFEAAERRLQPEEALPPPQASLAPGVTWQRPRVGDGASAGDVACPASPLDPQAFLQQVMADDRVPLALRIDAAKALLAHRG